MSTVTLVVMGVSGSGKTTVAKAVAEQLGWVFAEGDDFHTEAAVAKMRAGRPLTDEDRQPWLVALAAWVGVREAAGHNAVLTCSALKRDYRDILIADHASVQFAHVTAAPETIRQRLAGRRGHYMAPSMLDSQLAALEPLQPGERGRTVAGDGPPEQVVADIVAGVAG